MNNALRSVATPPVVRSDGQMGGYRWGLHVKAHLLAAEARADESNRTGTVHA